MIIRILSAGAPKAGIGACVEAFTAETGHKADITFATAPVLREKVEAGSANADIVVAPLAVMDGFKAEGRLAAGPQVAVGSVRAGIAVRDDTPLPDIASVESLEQTLRAAETVIYNEASSGQYIAEMIGRLGLTEELAARTLRLASGAAVMTRLAEGENNEIGFGQIPEIRRFEGRGVRLVGPLPDPLGKTTTYAAALLAGATAPPGAMALLDFMTAARGQRIFAGAGLE